MVVVSNAQTTLPENNNSKDEKFRIDMQGGIGFFNGLRVGSRVVYQKKYSMEVAYGMPFYYADPQRMVSFAVSYNFNSDKKAQPHLTMLYVANFGLENEGNNPSSFDDISNYTFSILPEIGYEWITSGHNPFKYIHLILRIGCRVFHGQPKYSNFKFSLFPQIDFVISRVIFNSSKKEFYEK